MSKKRKVEFLTPMCPTHGACVRSDDGELATLKPVKDGQNVAGVETVRLGERNEDGTYDVETLYDGRTESGPSNRSGPAYYATDASRASWDRVFGKKSSAEAN